MYQRKDIDWDMVRTSGDKKFIGKTNREAVQKGMTPQLPDGKFATLHHLGQDARGGLVEASRKHHDFNSSQLSNGKRAFDVLHSQHGYKVSHPEFPVKHSIFLLESRQYWKNRITEVMNHGK